MIITNRTSKKCSKCGVLKSLDEFHRQSDRTDGHCAFCKACKKIEDQRYRAGHIDQIRQIKRRYQTLHPEIHVKANRKYANLHPERARRSRSVWKSNNKHKVNSNTRVKKAVASGKLTREPCMICGDPKSHGHHSDYTQPLTVTWLCAKHHKEKHRKF